MAAEVSWHGMRPHVSHLVESTLNHWLLLHLGASRSGATRVGHCTHVRLTRESISHLNPSAARDGSFVSVPLYCALDSFFITLSSLQVY